MVQRATVFGAATTLVCVGLFTAFIGSFTAWGNEDRICYEAGEPVACTAEQQAAMQTAANAMGELVVTYGAGLLVLGLTGFGWLWWSGRVQKTGN